MEMHPHTAVARKDGRLISIPPPESGITGPHGPLGAGFIHLGAAKEIYTVLAELGANPERIIAEAGLDPRLFDDGNNLISFRALGHLLALCIERTNCPHFGLLVGRSEERRVGKVCTALCHPWQVDIIGCSSERVVV